MAEMQILTNASASGTEFSWPGGRGIFTVYSATFGGGTVKLQWSPDDGTTWIDVDRSGDTFVTLTAVGAGLFELPRCMIRGNVATATAVNAKVFTIPSGRVD